MVDLFEDAPGFTDSESASALFQDITAAEYFKRGQQMRARLKTKFTPRKRSFWKKITSFFY